MFVAIFLSTKRPKRIVTTFMHHCQATKWTKSLTCCQKLFKKFVVADVVDSAKFAAKLNFLQEAFRLLHRCDRVHQPVQVYQFSNLLLSQQRAAGWFSYRENTVQLVSPVRLFWIQQLYYTQSTTYFLAW